ncbi:Hypothetical protein FKW44_002696, partial [Caligus rogercresseyi]
VSNDCREPSPFFGLRRSYHELPQKLKSTLVSISDQKKVQTNKWLFLCKKTTEEIIRA